MEMMVLLPLRYSEMTKLTPQVSVKAQFPQVFVRHARIDLRASESPTNVTYVCCAIGQRKPRCNREELSHPQRLR